MRREVAAALSSETMEIIENGCYLAPSGSVVNIEDSTFRAILDRVHYSPELRLPTPTVGTHPTRLSTRNVTTLTAARSLREAGHDVVALNFASAKNPGGGFLRGSNAQEESLARNSALYQCIVGSPMYDVHSKARDAMYTSWALYAPQVPVFRDEDGTLLEEPWMCSFITCAAPNVTALREHGTLHTRAVTGAFKERINRILSIAAMHKHDAIVLGAWGCGVFGCDPDEVASLFDNALACRFRGVFSDVVFAVLDTTPERQMLMPFASRFPLDGPR